MRRNEIKIDCGNILLYLAIILIIVLIMVPILDHGKEFEPKKIDSSRDEEMTILIDEVLSEVEARGYLDDMTRIKLENGMLETSKRHSKLDINNPTIAEYKIEGTRDKVDVGDKAFINIKSYSISNGTVKLDSTQYFEVTHSK